MGRNSKDGTRKNQIGGNHSNLGKRTWCLVPAWEKWSDSEHTLQGEPSRFPDKLDVEYGRKAIIMPRFWPKQLERKSWC